MVDPIWILEMSVKALSDELSDQGDIAGISELHQSLSSLCWQVGTILEGLRNLEKEQME